MLIIKTILYIYIPIKYSAWWTWESGWWNTWHCWGVAGQNLSHSHAVPCSNRPNKQTVEFVDRPIYIERFIWRFWTSDWVPRTTDDKCFDLSLEEANDSSKTSSQQNVWSRMVICCSVGLKPKKPVLRLGRMMLPSLICQHYSCLSIMNF